MSNINENTVYTAKITVESVGSSDHFRVQVDYNPPINELELELDTDTLPTSFGVISSLIPVLLGQHEIALKEESPSQPEGDNVVELFGPGTPTVQ